MIPADAGSKHVVVKTAAGIRPAACLERKSNEHL